MKPILLISSSSFPRWKGDVSGHFVFALAEKIKHDFSVHVITPHYRGTKTREKMNGIHVHRFRYFFDRFEILAGETGMYPTLKKKKSLWLIVPFFLIAGLLSLFFKVIKTKPDVIHAHWTFPQGFQASLVKRILNIPFVITAHGTDVFGLSRGIGKVLNNQVFKYADKITVVSSALSEKVRTEYNPRTVPIIAPMGVGTKQFYNKPNPVPSKILITVGRLSETKGIEYLIKAMPLITKGIKNIQLCVIGSGELEKELKNLTTALFQDEFVKFTGKVENRYLPEYLAEADIFIGSSIETSSGASEGFGLTFIEASLSGCLLIGTSVGGIDDFLIDNQTGIVVPQKKPQAIAEAVLAVYDNWDSHINIAEQGQKYCIKNYDWDHVAQKYTDLINDCLRTKS